MALIKAGVPQGGILHPSIYIYASDQPITQDTLVADFADDKAIISIHENHLFASANLQIHLDIISQWYSKRRIKLNHNKSVHTTFTLKHGICPPVSVDDIPIPPLKTNLETAHEVQTINLKHSFSHPQTTLIKK